MAAVVFFLGGLRFPLLRPLFADAGIDLHELATQLLELAKLSHFALSFAHCGGSRQRLGDGLAIEFIGEAGMGTVPGLTGTVAAAVGLAATPRSGGNRTGAKIAELADLADDLSALMLQLLEGSPFHDVVVVRITEYNLLAKCCLMGELPDGFDSFLFLDVDTFILKDITFGFEMAERYGIAMPRRLTTASTIFMGLRG